MGLGVLLGWSWIVELVEARLPVGAPHRPPHW